MNNQNDNHADHYQQIVEDMPTGVALCKMIFDTSGKPIDFIYLKVNKAYGELTGLRNVIGKKVTEILPNVWQSDTELFEIYGRVALSGIPEHFERYIERLKSWLNISVYSPEKEHFVIMVENITGRKQTEEALRLRESYLSAIIENQPGLLWMKNRDGKFLAVNTEFSISSGMENPEMLVGKTDFDIWPQDLAARYVADDDRVMQSGKPCMVEEPISVEGTMQWFETFKAPIFDKQGTVIGTTGFSRDITERKKTESLLLNAQKLDSLGVLAGGIAHDFNNLLTGIFGFIDLARSVSKDAKTVDYLESTIAAMNRAKALTFQLLTFAKGGSPVQKTTPLIPFVQEAAQFALSGSNISCKFSLAETLWPCNIDKNQIGQVIDNIVINAQQAMPNGGAIEITAKNISPGLGEKSHPPLADGNYVKVSIKDFGIGIPKDIMPRIFDPFYTTKTKGHGLGLATCYSIMNRHGGCIDVESEPGKGSTFHVYLPASTVAAVTNTAAPGRHKGSGTIIVMDDEEVVRETIRKMLESLGYAVVCKKDGREAIDFYIDETRAKRKFAALIFDLTVPGGMGGIEAVAEIRKLNAGALPKVPVFVVSGYADNSVMKNPREYGFTASLSKPFTIAELSEMLNKNVLNLITGTSVRDDGD